MQMIESMRAEDSNISHPEQTQHHQGSSISEGIKTELILWKQCA